MRKPNNAVDGFVPRRSGRSIGDVHRSSLQRDGESENRPKVAEVKSQLGQFHESPKYNVSRRDIDDSLKDIDDDQPKPKKRSLFGRKKTDKQPSSRRKKIIKRVIKIAIILLILLGGYVGVKALFASSAIFKGNIFDLIQSKPLKTDSMGRTNLLIYGTSGSIDDENHPGANLTDSLLVMSIDQKKNNAYLMSIPRDLYVNMGAQCEAGYQAKINALYECRSNNGANEEAGAKALESKITDVTGLDIQYYAHVNWSVLVSAVDAVGGVDVDVQGNGPVPYGVKPGSILDRNFDSSCSNQCYFVKYEPGVHHLDGVHALALSRARNANGGYGLPRANYDREVNQQKILVALKKKATSAGTLANVGKVTSLIDALGANLKTDFQTSEIRTLLKLAQDIPSDKITTLSFVDNDPALVDNGNIAGQSVVLPTAGDFDYSEIQAFVKKKVYANEISKEDAHVAVFNGSTVNGYAKTQADKLESQGFTITAMDNAPEATYEAVEIYDLTNKKPATKAKLQQIYNTTVKGSTSPIEVSADTDFVIIYGKGSTSSSNSDDSSSQ